MFFAALLDSERLLIQGLKNFNESFVKFRLEDLVARLDAFVIPVKGRILDKAGTSWIVLASIQVHPDLVDRMAILLLACFCIF